MEESDLLSVLQTDPRDLGCDQAWAAVHVYAELVAGGDDPETAFPGITAHLAACGPCEDDFQGLLAALRAEVQERPAPGADPGP